MANLAAKHPTFDIRAPDWTLMRHSEAGERAIKGQRTIYLPPSTMMLTRGMQSPRQLGWQMYNSYIGRAVYHDIVRPALDAMLGVMHSKPADIKLPAKMQPMLDCVTFNGDNMQTLLQRINEKQLLTGRIGLMLDVQTGARVDGSLVAPNGAVKANGGLPYIVTYEAESIGNWDTSKVNDNTGMRSLQFVVLNETGVERTNGLTWQTIVKYRVLAMGDTTQDCFPGIPNSPVYCSAGVRAREDVVGGDFQAVVFPGGATLDAIPFVLVGPKDLVPEPDQPPLLPLARIALALYRGEADYRQALYLQGQQTLVTIGAQSNNVGAQNGLGEGEATGNVQEVGASATLELPLGGDAKYIGASADGLAQLAASIQEDKRQAAHLGANLLETQGAAAESGDALYIRTSAKTSSLTSVAKTGAAGLELLLKGAARSIGADPDQVSVEPNLEFSDSQVQALDLVNLMTAKVAGLPMSDETAHWFMAQNGFTNKTYDEEKLAMQDDAPPPVMNRGVAGNPSLDPNAPPVAKTKTTTGYTGKAPPPTSKKAPAKPAAK